DVILKTLGDLGRNTVAMERTVEYRGAVTRAWSTDLRFTIANMTAEFGGLNGIFEADPTVARWLAERRDENQGALYFRADDDAPYAHRYPINLDRLGPLVAKPFSPDNVMPVEQALGTVLHGCFIGACTTTEEELVLGALVLEQAFKDRPARPAHPKLLVVPGDLSIQARMKQGELWKHYEKAGFRIGPPGCAMCLGVASEKASPGETWLSSQNRNFENRMGQGSLAWLASAATVAASSVEMKIADPRQYLSQIDQARYAKLLFRDSRQPLPEVRHLEPTVAVAPAAVSTAQAGGVQGKQVEGRVQRFGDAVDTDAIIPGAFCHLTQLDELGQKAFHYVRPEFYARAKEGRTIVIAGEGWGSGSSREQAVWALLGAGITAVIARSYAFIHKRNLVNEALSYLVVKDPLFYELAQEDAPVKIDFKAGTVTVAGKTFNAEVPSAIVQALAREGGLVPAIKRHGKQVFEALSA
ncbi:MAG: 3-isopropylmalate dehydratase, large subunit, partial [Myxococcaceae bacterium]|nr:3-isopropylmalate dehydratase, large subunit [Myxococcaceae bacterium]